MREVLSKLVFTIVAAVVCLSLGVAPAAAEPMILPPPATPPPLPETDPFYSPAPELFVDLQPGQIIAARGVQIAESSAIPIDADAWQLSFRSTNTRDEPIAAVTTVIKPRGFQPDRPLLAFQVAEDSLGRWCAPSYQLQLSSVPGFVNGSMVIPIDTLFGYQSLNRGWALNIPDYQGLQEAFGAGPLNGRITLDSIRAAENFAPMQLPGSATRVGIAGYSGGSIPTGFAAELHRGYAPELRVVGVAEGGVLANIGTVLRFDNGQLGAGMIFAGVLGAAREYPSLARYIDQHINPFGKQLAQAKSGLCLSYQNYTVPFLNYVGLFDDNPFENPDAVQVINALAMGAAVPDMPMYIYHANPDWLMPVGMVNALVDTYCRAPESSIDYTRYHIAEHMTGGVRGPGPAIDWLADRFAGIPAAPGCRIHDVA